MKGKYRVLMWEQFRILGPILFWSYLFGTGIQVALQIDHPTNAFFESIHNALFDLFSLQRHGDIYIFSFTGEDVQLLSVVFGEVMAFLAACAICFRFDASGNLTGGFDERLLRLPIKTTPLVLTPLWMRVAFLSFFRVAQWGTLALLLGDYSWWWGMLLPIECYLAVQTLTWISGRIRGISYALILFGILSLVYLRLLGNEVSFTVSPHIATSILAIPHGVASLPGFLVVASFCSWLAIRGVTLRRRDEYAGPPGIGEAASRLVGRSEVTTFATANDALAWYAWRTGAWPMPLLTASLSLAFLLVNAIFLNYFDTFVFSLVFGPYIALFVSIFLSGMAAAFGERTEGAFIFRAPLDCAGIALARRCATAKGMALSFAIAIPWSLAGVWITSGKLPQALLEIVRADIYKPWEMAAIAAGPLVLIGGAAYGLTGATLGLGNFKKMALAIASCYFLLPSLATKGIMSYIETATMRYPNETALVLYVSITTIAHFILLFIIGLAAARKGLITATRLARQCALWGGVSLLFWVASREYGLSLPELYAIGVICSLPILLPSLWPPLAVYMARHR